MWTAGALTPVPIVALADDPFAATLEHEGRAGRGRAGRRGADERDRDNCGRERADHGGKNRPEPCRPLRALRGVVAELSLRPMAESDLFFRIKAGEQILTQHRLPGRNLFSFTYPDYPD